MTQTAREERNWDIVLADDLRPAGNGRDCFYCSTPLGGKHVEDCVIRKGAGWYLIAIKDNESGEVRLYRHDMRWDDTEEFQWMDNNYSCDCNRHLFFLRANGPGPAEDPYWNDAERECGDTKYSVLYVELPNGERVSLQEAGDHGPR